MQCGFNILYLTGVYNMEPLTDFNWNVMGMSLNLLYHFVVLEFFAIVSVLHFRGISINICSLSPLSLFLSFPLVFTALSGESQSHALSGHSRSIRRCQLSTVCRCTSIDVVPIAVQIGLLFLPFNCCRCCLCYCCGKRQQHQHDNCNCCNS